MNINNPAIILSSNGVCIFRKTAQNQQQQQKLHQNEAGSKK